MQAKQLAEYIIDHPAPCTIDAREGIQLVTYVRIHLVQEIVRAIEHVEKSRQAEIVHLQSIVNSLAERVYAQSELLTRRAEK